MKSGTRRPLLEVLVWAVTVFALMGLGLIPIYAFVPDLSTFNGNLPPGELALLGLGIELGATSPTVAAILVAWLMPGAGGARALFRQIKRWRIPAIWYVIAFFLPVPLLLTANLIWIALGKPLDVWLTLPAGLGIAFSIGASVVPPLGEELGWRGFAQARLQQRWPALSSAIVVGILWSTWHLWPLAVPGGAKLFLPSDVVQTYVRLIATAVIYAWIYNSTHGALLPVIVAHAGHNIWTTFIPGSSNDPTHLGPLIGSVLYFVVAVGVVLVTNPRTLTRTRPPRPNHRLASAQ